MMTSTYYEVYNTIKSSVNKGRRKKKDLTKYKYDISVDDEPVDVVFMPESHKVKYFRELVLQEKLINSREWVMLENKLLDKYFATGELISSSDIARILTLDIKPTKKYLIDKLTQEAIIVAEEPLFKERFLKNLEELERRVNLNRKKYLDLIKDYPRMNRYELLKKYYDEAIDGLGAKNNIKRLETLSRSLNGYKMNLNKYNDVLNNLPSDVDKYNDVYKTWYMTPNERTRHSGMDGVTVKGLDTLFKVVHDKANAIDYMRYPHDVENDYNNCANTCNCLCYYDVSIRK